jgi:hypothetical protein
VTATQMIKSYCILRYLLVVIVIAALSQVTVTEVLEDSGYPMTGANPQRNYQSNRPVRNINISCDLH